MMAARTFFAVTFPLALLVNLLLFGFIGQLIASHRLKDKPLLPAFSFDYVRIPEEQPPPPPAKRRLLPPKPKTPPPPKTTFKPTARPKATLRKLPLPVPQVKVELPMQVNLKVPQLPDLLVAGEVAPGPVQGPQLEVISASELTPLVRVPPRYPFSARRRRIEGYVVVEFTVTETGEVEDVRVIEASPRGVFERAAISAIKRWRFKPKMKEGKPIRVRARQKIAFKLR